MCPRPKGASPLLTLSATALQPLQAGFPCLMTRSGTRLWIRTFSRRFVLTRSFSVNDPTRLRRHYPHNINSGPVATAGGYNRLCGIEGSLVELQHGTVQG